MKTKNVILLLVSMVLLFSCKREEKIIRDPFIESLISQMTVEEKVGQMMQVTLDALTKGEDRYTSFEPVELDENILRDFLVKHGGGSILNTANNKARSREFWLNLINTIQTVAVNETRLGIPVIYGIDAIHGATYVAEATMFPQQIGMAATFNPTLMEEVSAIAAYETRASGKPWNFSPVLDLGSDPRWPRFWETFGEDPYLTTVMGVAMVRGYQGPNNDVTDPTRVAACLKHFYAYSIPFSGKDRTPAHLAEQELRDKHLPPFQAAIDAGALSVMLNSGIVNNISVHASKEIITDLLKTELGFRGLVVTDWLDIQNLYLRDRIARDFKEAIKISINAGVDMAMLPYRYQEFHKALVELVNEGKVSIDRIDDAVYRILSLKKALGLFENPTVNPENYPLFASEEFARKSHEAAAQSITLLSNKDNILPLNKNTRILVTGPNANSMRALNGGWSYSWQGEKTEMFTERFNTILEAFIKTGGMENIIFEPGVQYKEDGAYWEEENINIEAAVRKARNVDVILLALGENSYTEKPGDLTDLTISPNQEKLALAMAATGKPVILVINAGRPRLITSFAGKMSAILKVYLPGNFGGDALADIVYGNVNPSGRLPFTYPRYPNSLVTYIHKPSEANLLAAAGVYDYSGSVNALFNFGHGLSYSTVEYSNLSINKTNLTRNDSLIVRINVSNISGPAVEEVVKVFVSDLIASTTPDVKRLRAFEKVKLQPGEQKIVEFTLSLRDFSFINYQHKRVVEAGEFRVAVGNHNIVFNVEDDILFN